MAEASLADHRTNHDRVLRPPGLPILVASRGVRCDVCMPMMLGAQMMHADTPIAASLVFLSRRHAAQERSSMWGGSMAQLLGRSGP